MTTGRGGTIILGPEAGAGFGALVAALGDVNGDGIADFAVSAPTAGDGYAPLPGQTGVGQIYVFFGGQGDLAANINLAFAGGAQPDGVTFSGIQGNAASAGWGGVLSPGGDVNGDGIADLLIGAPDLDGLGSARQGLILYGKDGPWDAVVEVGTLQSGDATTITMPDGAAEGLTLVNLGDVNGDSFDDLLLGDPANAKAHLWFGTGANHPNSQSVTADLGEGKVTLTQVSGGFAVGDLNHDGLNDIALNTADGLKVVFGSDAMRGTLRDMVTINLTGINGFTLPLAQVTRAEMIRDINGDGIDDLLVEGREDTLAAQSISYVLFGTDDGFAASIDLSQLDGSDGFRMPGTLITAGMGGIGDADGDGIRDFLVADASGAGRVFLVFGRGSPFAATLDLEALDGQSGYVIQGLAGDALGGGHLADVNGDGFADLILGMPGRNGAVVVYGGPARLAALDLADGLADGIIHLAHLADPLTFEEPDPVPIGGGGTGTGLPTTVDDDLLGTPGADLNIDLLAGNDQYSALGGNDLILGNLGDDSLYGDTGADTLYGGAGRDLLEGGAGNDLLDGESGADTLAGGDGDDVLFVDDLGDVVRDISNGGQDSVQSSVSFVLPEWVEDLVLIGTGPLSGEGNSLNNRITGNAGNNALKGFGGWDQLFGGAGADTLIGGVGQDRLTGGGADGMRDVFVFQTRSESPRGGVRDVITDFERRVDDIDLRLIDANLRKAGNQAFHFSGSAAQAYSVWWYDLGADLVLRCDVNGDRRPDFEIRLNAIARLSSGDLLL